jgi:uncharacterized membrane protein
MDGWTIVRVLHVLALAFFVGGQLMLLAAVVPAARRHDAAVVMRSVARRFGAGSAVALVVLVATGAAMASRTDRWDDGVLQVKLTLVVLIGVLTALHVVTPRSRAVSAAVFAASVATLWLGVELAHG